MQPVIYPVNKAKLLAELTEERFIRKTNKGGNEIYSFNAFNSPNLMKEVGRLRELTFRTAGGGTGKEVDIDPFDVDEQVPYQQLIVWDPKEQEILGGYRYILCDNLPLNQEGEPNLATTELFRFSEAFKKQYLTKMIELGRSFVQPLYQSTKMGRKSLFALDNLWDGLGALTVENPGMEYFFGKVTMYTSFNIEARDMILFFMRKYFKDTERLVEPITPLEIHIDDNKLPVLDSGISVTVVKRQEKSLVSLDNEIHQEILSKVFEKNSPTRYNDLVNSVSQAYEAAGYKRGVNGIKDLLKLLTGKGIIVREKDGYVYKSECFKKPETSKARQV